MDQGKGYKNKLLQERTTKMAVDVYFLCQKQRSDKISGNLINQIIRSSSSTAANLHASFRARSDAEFYSKICIVTEECDETLFWLNYIKRVGLFKEENLNGINDEVEQLVKIFNSIKKKMKEKIGKR